MAEPARKFNEDDVLPEDAVLGPGTYKNVDTGRIVRKDKYGPLPPSGQSKRYVMLSDDPTYGLSAEGAKEHQAQVRGEREATSYEHPATSRMVKTGEVVSPGSYRCTNCGNEVTFKDEGHMPPCSVCAHTEWRRIH